MGVNVHGEERARRYRIAQRYWYPLAASALIMCGVALRLALILAGWPHTNSEEGTMGLEAMHILLRGARPIYYYGQNYMGVGEAYIASLAFRVFGISVVSLRLGMLVFYAIFMVGVSWLASLLYSRRVALMSLAALVVGTPFAVRIQLLADGGKAETLAFGAMMFALASWLALSPPPEKTALRSRALHYAAFFAWGLIAGLGLYTYAIIAPFVLASGSLLWITRWRALLSWILALPLLGFLIGLLPVILYTATMPFADNPISVFLSLHQSLNTGGATGEFLLVKQIVGTLLYTMPSVTGLLSLYPLQALPLFGPLSRMTFAAMIIGGGWSVGYLFLLGSATYRPLRALWRTRSSRSRSGFKSDDRQGEAPAQSVVASRTAQDEARDVGRLMLAITAWLTIAAYMFSATAANNPYSGRYLIGLLVILPAVLWPLVERKSRDKGAQPVIGAGASARIFPRGAGRSLGLALLGASLLLSAFSIARSVPDAMAANGRDTKLAHDLLSHGITRFYADYWACDLLNFETRERLTCAVIDEYAQPGLTRYSPYYAMVQADREAPYALERGSSIERTFLIHAKAANQRYSVQYLDGRDIYTPLAT